MAVKIKRPKGAVGELNGLVITKRMWQKDTKALPVVSEFLQFVEAMNRGKL